MIYKCSSGELFEAAQSLLEKPSKKPTILINAKEASTDEINF